MQDLTALEGKTLVELRAIAKVLGIDGTSLKKRELLAKIVETAGEAPQQEPEQSQPQPAKRGRRPRMGGVKVGGEDVRSYDLETLRNQVAVVLQKNVLFSSTVLENLR